MSAKTAVAQALLALCPNTFLLDKDQTAAGFILEAAALRGDAPAAAYGTPHYWQKLRPLEYASTLAAACANLVGTRQVLLVGGLWPRTGRGRPLEGSSGKHRPSHPPPSSTSIRRLWTFGAPAWSAAAPAPTLPTLPISPEPSVVSPSGLGPFASRPTAPCTQSSNAPSTPPAEGAGPRAPRLTFLGFTLYFLRCYVNRPQCLKLLLSPCYSLSQRSPHPLHSLENHRYGYGAPASAGRYPAATSHSDRLVFSLASDLTTLLKKTALPANELAAV